MHSKVPPKLFKGVHHVAFTVGDLDRSIAFYSMLGFELASRWKEGPDICAEGIGVPGASIELAQLKGHSMVLELIAFAAPAAEKLQPTPAHAGNGHLAFNVIDIDVAWSAIHAAGGKTVSAVKRDPAADWFQLMDPDGIRVEFVQVHGAA